MNPEETTPQGDARFQPDAQEQLLHSFNYNFRDRKARKGDFRKLWIQRIKYVEEHIDPSIEFKVVVCAVDEKLNEPLLAVSASNLKSALIAPGYISLADAGL